MQTLLEIKNLKTSYRTIKGYVHAVDDVSIDVYKKSALGLVGESGCGKTTLALSIPKLLPNNADILGGQIVFNGEDLISKDEKGMQKIRWKKISVVFQAAMNALNPVYRVGDQIAEAILTHENLSKEEAMERVIRRLELVGLGTACVNLYPHECSGGMKQRVMIAMALACDPELVILDEPTTALDTIVQKQIIDEIKKLEEKLALTILCISHDIWVITRICERIAVMYGGKLIEMADTEPLIERPNHPYTRALVASFPTITGAKRDLPSIAGSPPSLLIPPLGCRFHPRCLYAKDICQSKDPKLIEMESGHYVACHFARKFA